MTYQPSVQEPTTGVVAGSGRPSAAEATRHAVTAILLALLVCWMFGSWWSAPRLSDEAALDRALEAGEVTSYIRADGFERTGGFWASTRSPLRDADGSTLVWQSADGRTHVVPARSPIGAEWLADDPRGGSAGTARLEARLAAAGVQQAYDPGSAPMLALLLVVGGLAVLVGGAPPRRGTRWFWFWVGGVTAGVGVLAWLVLERIRPPRTAPLVRSGGGLGFVVMIVGSIAVSVLAGALVGEPGFIG